MSATPFDYATLDAETRIIVQIRTQEIKMPVREIQDLVNIGQKLIEVKARLGYDLFVAWLAAEFSWNEDAAYQFMTLGEQLRLTNSTESKLAPSTLQRLVASVRRYVKVENDYLNDPKAVQPTPLLKPRQASLLTRAPGREAEYETPKYILDCVTKVLGTLDLCISVSPAATDSTDDERLLKPWYGKVFLSCPSDGAAKAWIDKLCTAYAAGSVSSAIALIPSRTDATWWRQMAPSSLCFIHGALSFGSYPKNAVLAVAAVYFGRNLASFARAFGTVGSVYVAYQDYKTAKKSQDRLITQH
jgi:hypothetical protein